MRIRPYRSKDFTYLKGWIKSEEEHILWCANMFRYPLTEDALEKARRELDEQTDGSFFTALDQQGTPIGFFAVMRVDYTMNNAHLGFIILDPTLRGKGIGTALVNFALGYCFSLLTVASVTLKVYDKNEVARKCYESIGFAEVVHNEKSLVVGEEKWGVWDMIITRNKMFRL